MGPARECSGLGYRMEVDPELVVDREKPVRAGALLPWTHSTQHYYPQIVKSVYGSLWVQLGYSISRTCQQEVQEKLLYGTDERIRFPL